MVLNPVPVTNLNISLGGVCITVESEGSSSCNEASLWMETIPVTTYLLEQFQCKSFPLHISSVSELQGQS